MAIPSFVRAAFRAVASDPRAQKMVRNVADHPQARQARAAVAAQAAQLRAKFAKGAPTASAPGSSGASSGARASTAAGSASAAGSAAGAGAAAAGSLFARAQAYYAAHRAGVISFLTANFMLVVMGLQVLFGLLQQRPAHQPKAVKQHEQRHAGDQKGAANASSGEHKRNAPKDSQRASSNANGNAAATTTTATTATQNNDLRNLALGTAAAIGIAAVASRQTPIAHATRSSEKVEDSSDWADRDTAAASFPNSGAGDTASTASVFSFDMSGDAAASGLGPRAGANAAATAAGRLVENQFGSDAAFGVTSASTKAADPLARSSSLFGAVFGTSGADRDTYYRGLGVGGDVLQGGRTNNDTGVR